MYNHDQQHLERIELRTLGSVCHLNFFEIWLLYTYRSNDMETIWTMWVLNSVGQTKIRTLCDSRLESWFRNSEQSKNLPNNIANANKIIGTETRYFVKNASDGKSVIEASRTSSSSLKINFPIEIPIRHPSVKTLHSKTYLEPKKVCSRSLKTILGDSSKFL